MDVTLDDGDRWRVIDGESLEILRDAPDDHFDALVTDPPAGIGFMGEDWDSDKGGRQRWVDWLAAILEEAARTLKPAAPALVWALPKTSHWTGLALERAGFKIEDKLAHLFGSGMPKGGHLDRKIDRALGRKGDRPVIGQYESPENTTGDSSVESMYGGPTGINDVTAPASDLAAQWDGTSTTLAPAREDWWLARAPKATIGCGQIREALGGADHWCTKDHTRDGTRHVRMKALHEGADTLELALDAESGETLSCEREPFERWTTDSTVAHAVVYGVGALEIDGCRVGISSDDPHLRPNAPNHDKTEGGYIYTEQLSANEETKDMGRHTSDGRWPAHTILGHHADCEPVGWREVEGGTAGEQGRGPGMGGRVFADPDEPDEIGSAEFVKDSQSYTDGDGTERVRDWDCHERCPVRIVDAQSGERPSTKAADPGASGRVDHPSDADRKDAITYGGKGLNAPGTEVYADTGGASRFFTRFKYAAKASPKERDAGVTGDGGEPARLEHKTVKPVDLMRWLVRLVTPTGGTVLDPFCGSGTTGIGCLLEGARFVGVEADASHASDARDRLECWAEHGEDAPEVWAEHKKRRERERESGQATLFDDDA